MKNEFSTGDKIAVGIIVIALFLALSVFVIGAVLDFITANEFCQAQGFDSGLASDLGSIGCYRGKEARNYTIEEVENE